MSEIREWRLKAGMTQAQMAEYFGIPLKTLVNWEQGRRKPSEWVERLLIKDLKLYIETAKERD